MRKSGTKIRCICSDLPAGSIPCLFIEAVRDYPPTGSTNDSLLLSDFAVSLEGVCESGVLSLVKLLDLRQKCALPITLAELSVDPRQLIVCIRPPRIKLDRR